VDGLHKSLGQVGDGVGGFGFTSPRTPAGMRRPRAALRSQAERVLAGEEVGQVFAEFFCGAGSGFFLGVVEAEAGMFAGARSAATAAIRERNEHKDTRSFALREDIHFSLELSFGIAC